MLFLKVSSIFPKWIYPKILEENSGPVYLKQGYLDSNFSLILNSLKMHLACHVSVLLWAGLGPHFLFLVGIIQWESLLHFNYTFVMFVCYGCTSVGSSWLLLGFYKESGFTAGVSEVAQKLVGFCLVCTNWGYDSVSSKSWTGWFF